MLLSKRICLIIFINLFFQTRGWSINSEQVKVHFQHRTQNSVCRSQYYIWCFGKKAKTKKTPPPHTLSDLKVWIPGWVLNSNNLWCFKHKALKYKLKSKSIYELFQSVFGSKNSAFYFRVIVLNTCPHMTQNTYKIPFVCHWIWYLSGYLMMCDKVCVPWIKPVFFIVAYQMYKPTK